MLNESDKLIKQVLSCKEYFYKNSSYNTIVDKYWEIFYKKVKQKLCKYKK